MKPEQAIMPKPWNEEEEEEEEILVGILVLTIMSWHCNHLLVLERITNTMQHIEPLYNTY